MSGAHSPRTLQPTNGTLSSFKKETIHSCTLTSCAKRTHTPSAFFFPLAPLFYTRSREKISLSWEVQKWVTNWDMSHDYTCTNCTHPSAFCTPYFLSWVVVQERKLYTHQHHYTPFRGSPEMSDKLRYEWQIILRYYPHIIHDVSLERPTTSPFPTIHLERQTTPHLLSHRTTHLQYWWKDYAYSLTQ